MASTSQPMEQEVMQTEAGAIPADYPSRKPAGAESEGRLRGSLRARTRQWKEAVAKRFALSRIPKLQEHRNEAQQAINDIPNRMQKVTNQASLVLELVDDFRTGRYRELPWYTIAVASGALLYAVSPADAIPDVVPLVGAIDDLFVITIAMNLIRSDLRAYCEFKGYDPANYF